MQNKQENHNSIGKYYIKTACTINQGLLSWLEKYVVKVQQILGLLDTFSKIVILSIVSIVSPFEKNSNHCLLDEWQCHQSLGDTS
jgi:hypothetical protein